MLPQKDKGLKVLLMFSFICILLSVSTKFPLQRSVIPFLPSFEESHIKNGRVCIHELEQEGLQDEALLKVGFRFRNF